ncbi:MAG: ATP-binding protein [Nostoc sp. NOS(2021)]|uniref:hypothetical protein n=1 Tax=Nostoc sp. NOS(2021) TaxID=2815407 RepID=UPI0025EEAC2A|nr:hypothetical protein [Nostoc sp. NOS(2021)]MBN3899431.1 ATP-binding protein [Nostoc sp. NOS(2021)]
MLKQYKSSHIFVPGGMPQHTYVARSERNLENKLRSATDNLCKLVTITGATKSGKTVLTNKVFPRNEKGIWIDGGTIGEENDLWNYILTEIQGYTDLELEKSQETTSSIKGQIEAEASIPLFLKGKGNLGSDYSQNRGMAQTKSISLSPRSAAITQLRKANIPLIIDDFHYLDRDFQGNIIRALKPLIFEGLPVILIAIPHRRYDAVKVEREITGRLESIPIPTWNDEELLEIPNEGFPLLNVHLSKSIGLRLASEAYGSPHLMQEFCRELTSFHKVETTLSKRLEIDNISDELFIKVAEGTGKIVFDKLAKGPRQRTDRLPRMLKSGETADIYKVILLALAQLSPGLETIEYEQLRAVIKDVLIDNIPQGHEVTRVLEKMTEIASSDEASTPVLDWDKEEQKLHITDPFFAFFLKWGVEHL